MFCMNCGEKLPDEAKYCCSCGDKVLKTKTASKKSNKKNSQIGFEKLKQDIVKYELGIEWVKIPAGSFDMGSNDGGIDEQSVHRVHLDKYYISKYETTFEQYDKFCENTGRCKPSDEGWGRGNRPVINVSWNDAMAYCKWLSKKTGLNISLPTEAQWEYVARGGKYSRGYKYSGSNRADDVAWYDYNSGNKTHLVGQKQENELGIYDMSGNVWEWCFDWFDSSYYSSSPTNNPNGPSSGSYRVNRGGSWNLYANFLRSTFRLANTPSYRFAYLGFRLSKTE